MDVELIDLVTRGVNRGQLEGIQLFVLKVEDPITVHANEVVVLMDLVVETSRDAGVANPIDDSHADQCIKHAVHRCPRHAWQPTLDGTEYVLSSGMIITREDSLQEGPPLYRYREALPAAQVLELLKPFSPR